LNQQKDETTSQTFACDFDVTQAIGTLRSLFLFYDDAMTKQPQVFLPAAASGLFVLPCD
jgi:hypothetical protein